MAKKTGGSRRNSSSAKPLKAASRSTPVRKSSIPKSTARPRRASQPVITYELIAQRAYEIWLSGTGGDEMSNWLRAERELRGM